jgi:hypothetical protein
MIRTFKNSQQLSMALAIAFFVAILVCGYTLYALPAELGFPSGYETAMTKVYWTMAITFVVGSVAIFLALSAKKEVIVFKTKTSDGSDADSASAEEGQKTSISLEHIKLLEGNDTRKTLHHDFLQAICDQLEAGQGAYYETMEEDGIRKIRLKAGYALAVGEGSDVVFDFGEGLAGQAASEGRTLYVDDIPEGYIKIVSGLGTASPRYLLIVPVKNENNVQGIIEMASFKDFTKDQRKFVEEAAEILVEKMVSN